MNPKGTCPLAGEDSSCVAEHRNAGTHFLQVDPRVLRAKRPSMDGQCGSLRRTMPKCNRPGQMKTIKTVKAMKTGHSDCLPTVSPSSPPSITRSAQSCLACQSNFKFIRIRGSTPTSFSIFPLRSEEHTSELQSRLHLVCRLLLEKKKTDLTLIAYDPLPPCLPHLLTRCARLTL